MELKNNYIDKKLIKLFISNLEINLNTIFEKYSYNKCTRIKDDGTIVTKLDTIIESNIISLILKFFPSHSILAEESGIHKKELSEFKWIIDPLDGTKSFVYGHITYGTLIALQYNDEIILGLMYIPHHKKLVIAYKNKVQIGNNNIEILSSKKELKDCLLLSTDILTLTKECGNFSLENIEIFKDYRTWGNCYGYYQIILGNADVMIDPLMSPWDIAALIPIIKWSGGIITDCYGNEANLKSKGIIASSNLLIHKKVLELINF